MTIPNWLEAPEGATHFDTSDGRVNSFMKLADGVWFYWPPASKTPEWTYWNHEVQDLKDMIPAPPPAWNGSGLPPVGTVCEMIGCKADPEAIDYAKYKNHIGKNVTIVAHHDVGRPAAVYACAVGDGEFEYYSMIAGCFAPVRTQAQIAAEIREKAIKDLMQIDGVYYQQGADIYDRGYRKFEIVDE